MPLSSLALVGYWVLVHWVPVPGAGMPGRDVPFLDKDQNIVAWVDRQLMPGHLYEDYATHNLRDPEGLLSDIPASAPRFSGCSPACGFAPGADLKTKAIGLAFWCSGLPRLRLFLVHLVSAQQENVDQFLCAGRCRLVAWPSLRCSSGPSKSRVGEKARPNKSGLWLRALSGRGSSSAPTPSPPTWSANCSPASWNSFPSSRTDSKTNALAWVRIHLFDHIPNPGWAAFGYSFTFMAVCFIPVWILYRKKIFLKV